MRLRWRTAANIELLKLVGYVFPRNRKAARDLHAKTRLRVRQLEMFPRSGRLGRMEGTREFVVHETPYLVVYAIENEAVVILSVLHSAQQWPPGED